MKETIIGGDVPWVFQLAMSEAGESFPTEDGCNGGEDEVESMELDDIGDAEIKQHVKKYSVKSHLK